MPKPKDVKLASEDTLPKGKTNRKYLSRNLFSKKKTEKLIKMFHSSSNYNVPTTM